MRTRKQPLRTILRLWFPLSLPMVSGHPVAQATDADTHETNSNNTLEEVAITARERSKNWWMFRRQ